ncbi:MAG TPA: HNH endonuclease, partial [Dermatophilaceae bacterium]|nr:HNH endonuclease [Dermatophilaceae bacterium]
VANRSLSAVEGTSRSAKYRIYVHLDTDGGWIGKGGRLPSHIVDAMTCDGVLAPVWETDGVPVSVGRSQRVVPDRTRRLIESRDQGCRYPGCVGAGHVEAHHIVHWRNGGRTDLDQLVSLCPYHHDRHHEGEFTISGTPATPTGLTFWARGGWPIRPLAPDRRVAPDRQERPPATRWVGPTGERLQTKFLLLGRNPSPRAP